MPDTEAQAEWVSRILGVDLGGAGRPEAYGPLLDIWQEAKDAVDSQLDALYGTLRDTDIPVLAEVANEIEGVLGNYRVGLMVALLDFDHASGEALPAARAKALKVVRGYQSSLASDKHVAAADTNPFGVHVTVRETLGGALMELQGLLAA